MNIESVASQIECTSCPWNKNCIEPPPMTREEIEAKIKEPDKSENLDKPDMGRMCQSFRRGGLIHV